MSLDSWQRSISAGPSSLLRFVACLGGQRVSALLKQGCISSQSCYLAGPVRGPHLCLEAEPLLPCGAFAATVSAWGSGCLWSPRHRWGLCPLWAFPRLPVFLGPLAFSCSFLHSRSLSSIPFFTADRLFPKQKILGPATMS